MQIIQNIFGSRNERVLKRMRKVVESINTLEQQFTDLDDAELTAKTGEFRERLAQGESLDQILPEAFATVREASKRVLGMRHFDVQLIGGMVLHEGNIAEMRTGEGKTLVSTLPAYLNAIEGKGVHIVTVNDYLAKRDARWMGPVHEFLGLSVGVIMPDMPHEEKQAAYSADITYGTNNEFGFDYLRDNMAFSIDEKVQQPLNFAIVDEVDSILIDEARTPLIISGAAEDSSKTYISINKLIPSLKPEHYTLDEKQRSAHLTEAGHQVIESLLLEAGLLDSGDSLYSAANISLMHHVSAALRAQHLYTLDVDYIVSNDEVIIVDEHTGRTMPGRRWSDGLHQAIEAKEGVKIQQENQTLASITFQNYFRLYNKLSGMTGTADTEAFEFQQIYELECVVMPTNKPMIRDDQSDLIFLDQGDKYRAIIEDIVDCQKRKQPTLVGTASIESSEQLSQLLKKQNIKHAVLNAKFHEQEAKIIAEAGRPGSVTIATNMAGRGTDIVLGGHREENESESDWKARHQQVIDAGGLRIIGSERHESRRIDNQLRGRAGRQGDPGSSRFYLSLEDNLLRIFASERTSQMMQRLGMKSGEALEHKLLNRTIENAQRKVEAYNFDVRKQLLQYDDVANDQRKVIYSQRAEIMAAKDLKAMIEEIIDSVITDTVHQYIPPLSLEEQWNPEGLMTTLKNDFALECSVKSWVADEDIGEETIIERVIERARALYKAKEDLLGRHEMAQFEKSVLLQSLDTHWREHLASMDHLRQGIHLRGYAQKDPRQEYKREAFELFTVLLDNIKQEVASIILRVEIRSEDVDVLEAQRREALSQALEFQHEQSALLEPAPSANQDDKVVPFKREEPKVGRNDPCPCGSGKKYKQCHGRL